MGVQTPSIEKGVHFILLSNLTKTMVNNYSVFKLSAFSKHTCFESCTQRVNGCAGDALFNAERNPLSQNDGKQHSEKNKVPPVLIY